MYLIRAATLCCLLELLKNPESKMASGWSGEDKMVSPTIISLWLTSWSSQRVLFTMTSWSSVKDSVLVVSFKIYIQKARLGYDRIRID